MWRVDSLEKTLMLRGIGGRRKRGRQRMASPTRWTWVWVNSGSWWWTGRPGVLQFIGLQRDGHDWVTKLNWTEWLIQNLSLQSHFLTCPLQQKQKNKQVRKKLESDSACDLIFKSLTNILGENPALFHPPDFDKVFLVQTDDSDIRLEALLSLIMKEEKQPVMCTFKKLLKGKTL